MSRTSGFRARSRIAAPAREVYDWHLRPGAFERLSPPWERVEIEPAERIGEGTRRTLRIAAGPFRIRWEAVHRGFEPGRGFRDEQARGPFASWVHSHEFEPEGEAASTLVDRIDYRFPLGPLGRMLAGAAVRSRLRRMFRWRHEITAADLERHHRASRPMAVAITGASGLIGTALGAFLSAGGHDVRRVVRRAARGQDEIAWDPAAGTTDPAAWEGLDAVVHLAGAGIADARWTPAVKRRIRASRVDGTALVARTLARLERPPRVLVSASAIGYYGDRGDEVVDEDSPPGEGFLAEVCRAWEAATAPAAETDIRTVAVRTGVVLTPGGGALAKMLPPFLLGLGGRLGGGGQHVPWITLDDLVGVVHEALANETLAGPVNAVAPDDATNADLTRALGRVLRRPALLPVPAFAIRSALGEMGRELLLASARVRPARLEAAGFRFRYRDLEPALRFVLGRPGGSVHVVQLEDGDVPRSPVVGGK